MTELPDRTIAPAAALDLRQLGHELRTPLNAVLGFSEAMVIELHGPHAAPVYAEYAGHIHRAGQELAALVRRFIENNDSGGRA